MAGRADGHRLWRGFRRLRIHQHQRGGAVRHRRTIGALQRPGDERILLALGTAEVVAEILAYLREGIGYAIPVILRRDHRQRIRLVAVFLEVGLRDLAEHAGEAAGSIAILRQVGGA